MELRNLNFNNHLTINDNHLTIILDLELSKPFVNNHRYKYESITSKVFVDGVDYDNFKVLFNHEHDKPLTRKAHFEAISPYKVKIDVDLPEGNMYTEHIKALKNENLLEVSFGFSGAESEFIRMGDDKVRHIKKLTIKELSLLSTEGAYNSEIRWYDDVLRTQAREEILKDLKKIHGLD